MGNVGAAPREAVQDKVQYAPRSYRTLPDGTKEHCHEVKGTRRTVAGNDKSNRALYPAGICGSNKRARDIRKATAKRAERKNDIAVWQDAINRKRILDGAGPRAGDTVYTDPNTGKEMLIHNNPAR